MTEEFIDQMINLYTVQIQENVGTSSISVDGTSVSYTKEQELRAALEYWITQKERLDGTSSTTSGSGFLKMDFR